MPLRLVPPRAGKSPHWTIRGHYLGVGRIDRSTKTGKRAIALKVLRELERQIERGEFSEPGEPTFALAATNYMMHGGERTYVKRLLEHFGTTPLRGIGQAQIDAAALVLYPDGTAATRNRSVYTPMSAILAAAGAGFRLRRPKNASGARATHWFRKDQAFALFKAARGIDPEFAALIIFLTYTGLRLGEALGLTWNNVDLQRNYAYVPDTKNDEPRAVFFLPPVAVACLACMELREGRVFSFSKGGHLYSLLKAAAFKADVDLPERSAFHIFRHTYATWMRQYGGIDIKGLVATGAWRDMKSAERYAHAIVTDEAKRALRLPTPNDAEGLSKGSAKRQAAPPLRASFKTSGELP